jgi:hypothetical protein
MRCPEADRPLYERLWICGAADYHPWMTHVVRIALLALLGVGIALARTGVHKPQRIGGWTLIVNCAALLISISIYG